MFRPSLLTNIPYVLKYGVKYSVGEKLIANRTGQTHLRGSTETFCISLNVSSPKDQRKVSGLQLIGMVCVNILIFSFELKQTLEALTRDDSKNNLVLTL